VPVKLSIRSNIHDYSVFFENDGRFVDELARIPQACFVIDENVWNIYSDTLLKSIPTEATIILPISEERKNLATVQELYDRLIEWPFKRNLTLVSFGGGVAQDITGFTASTIYRGINWVYIPTTLLAQADSCLGSKTSLNYKNYKNIIGTFFPPTEIHLFPSLLHSLPTSDFYSGFGEVIKLHLMGGVSVFEKLVNMSPRILALEDEALTDAIRQALNIKIDYMSNDEFDKGRRNLLNFGHDFGHAVESTSNFQVPHGQAIIFGMIAANLIAQVRGMLDPRIADRISGRLLYPSLVIKPAPSALNHAEIIEAMKMDKKRTGEKLPLILMNSNFEFSRVNDLTEDEVSKTLDVLATRLS
jgi:3-dehydroquinate synthase